MKHVPTIAPATATLTVPAVRRGWQHEPPHAKSHIKKVIGVVSGKGGVGKSMTSAMMAVSMRRKGYKVGVLDADITGPSIPKLFGVHGPAMGTEDGINPVESHTGIKIMSINLLLEDEEAPVVWRGPVIAGAVKQFWQEVIWDDVDFYLSICLREPAMCR